MTYDVRRMRERNNTRRPGAVRSRQRRALRYTEKDPALLVLWRGAGTVLTALWRVTRWLYRMTDKLIRWIYVTYKV